MCTHTSSRGLLRNQCSVISTKALQVSRERFGELFTANSDSIICGSSGRWWGLPVWNISLPVMLTSSLRWTLRDQGDCPILLSLGTKLIIPGDVLQGRLAIHHSHRGCGGTSRHPACDYGGETGTLSLDDLNCWDVHQTRMAWFFCPQDIPLCNDEMLFTGSYPLDKSRQEGR